MAVRPNPVIYLVRHGETEWNAEGRYQGRLDSPLTGRGLAQAEACGRRLAGMAIEIDSFVTSPLGRARQTASIIAASGSVPEMRLDDRLAEVSNGDWDGLTQIDIDAQWPGLLDGTTPFDWYFRSPGGESYAAVVDRVEHWLGELDDGVTIAVSHGLVGRIVRGVYLGLASDEALSLPIPQNAIWRLADGRIEAVNT